MPRRDRVALPNIPLHLKALCLRYIELDPVRAAMVKRPADYHLSNFAARDHGQGKTQRTLTTRKSTPAVR